MTTEPVSGSGLAPQPKMLRSAFGAAAVGRIALGGVAFIAPRSQTKMNGVPDELLTTELTYLVRIFGARALALGVGYLTSDEPNKRRWQRIGLMVDTLDNINALLELKKLEPGDRRVRTVQSLMAVTAPYAALGVIGAVHGWFAVR